MEQQSGMYYDQEIDFSPFIYTDEVIQSFETKAHEIEKYFHLPVSNENFN